MRALIEIAAIIVVTVLLILGCIQAISCAWRSPSVTYNQSIYWATTNQVPTNALIEIQSTHEFLYEGSPPDIHYK